MITAKGVEDRFRGEARRWDAIYSEGGSWPARIWDRLTRRNVRWRFARTFQEMPNLHGKSVLDLGCGSGRYLVEALDRGADRVVGVDFAPEMLAVATQLLETHPSRKHVELRCEDLQRFAVSERFDLIIANGLFDYLAPAAPMIAQAAERCRGVFIASFPDKKAIRALPRQLYWQRRGVDIHAFDHEEIEALAKPAGFGSYAIEHVGPLYLLVARAKDTA